MQFVTDEAQRGDAPFPATAMEVRPAHSPKTLIRLLSPSLSIQVRGVDVMSAIITNSNLTP